MCIRDRLHTDDIYHDLHKDSQPVYSSYNKQMAGHLIEYDDT